MSPAVDETAVADIMLASTLLGVDVILALNELIVLSLALVESVV